MPSIQPFRPLDAKTRTKAEEQQLLEEFKVALELMKEPQSAFDEKMNPTQNCSPAILRAPGFGASAPAGSIPLRSLTQSRTSTHSVSPGGERAARTHRNGYNVELVRDEELSKTSGSSRSASGTIAASARRSKVLTA